MIREHVFLAQLQPTALNTWEIAWALLQMGDTLDEANVLVSPDLGCDEQMMAETPEDRKDRLSRELFSWGTSLMINSRTGSN